MPKKPTSTVGGSPGFALPFELPSTQRAYTLRLRPAIARGDTPEEVARKTREMRDALWATHETINKGAKAFGDWLLTLRGWLSH